MQATKRCAQCWEIKSLDGFHIHRVGKKAGKLFSYCKSCISKRNKAYREDDPERFRAADKKYRSTYPEKIKESNRKYRSSHREEVHIAAKRRLEKARQEMLEFFGYDCEICGENLVEFLTIDHIEGNGAGQEARRSGAAPGWYGIWNICNKAGWKDSLRDIYRILCFNCNCSRDRRPNPYQDWRASLGAPKAQECLT